jgi:hypothetical protein
MLRKQTLGSTALTFINGEGTTVDLHWATTPADYPSQITQARLWASVRSVSIAGRKVPVLSDECELVFLCIHATRHCWTHLRWLCDIVMLIATAETINWRVVVEIAAEARAARPVCLGLLLARDLLHLDIPEEAKGLLVEEARLTPFVRRLAERLQTPQPLPKLSGLRRAWFNARLAPSRCLGARHLAALLHAPTDADLAVLRLPRPLFPLYYPFRIARLATKYGKMILAR